MAATTAAGGFGCHAGHVVEPGVLRPALERAFASRKPACGHVMTDPNVIAPVTRAMVGAPPPKPATGSGEPGTVQIPYYDDLEG